MSGRMVDEDSGEDLKSLGMLITVLFGYCPVDTDLAERSSQTTRRSSPPLAPACSRRWCFPPALPMTMPKAVRQICHTNDQQTIELFCSGYLYL
ncbi:hypothetical protein COP2_044726 [Malus domestica]